MNALPDQVAPAHAELVSRRQRQLVSHLDAQIARAVIEFGMIEDGDVVMVCCSGGKDSYSLLSLLLRMQRRAPVKFRLVAVNLDQKQPGFDETILPRHFEALGVEYRIVERDTYSVVRDKIPAGKTMCSLCSRLRRGILYATASELGATKIALGHHLDDIVETLFLNMFFGGTMKAMAPKLGTDDGRHVVIRPLSYCRERDLAKFAQAMAFPIIPCNLCGSQENMQRRNIKHMLQEWDRQDPKRVENIFGALTRVVPSHLADTRLFDFLNLGHGAPSAQPGDPQRDLRLDLDPLQESGISPATDLPGQALRFVPREDLTS